MKAWQRDQRVLLAVSGVLIVVSIVFCVLAEQSAMWFQTQASLAAILVLLGLVAWNWWHSQKSAFIPEAAALPANAAQANPVCHRGDHRYPCSMPFGRNTRSRASSVGRRASEFSSRVVPLLSECCSVFSLDFPAAQTLPGLPARRKTKAHPIRVWQAAGDPNRSYPTQTWRKFRTGSPK